MKSIQDAILTSGMKVLVRGDLDVPLNNLNEIEDTYRLDLMFETLKMIIDKGGFPVICGHLGRPGGKFDASLSSSHLASYFDDKLGKDRYKLLENLRFDPGEESNDSEFAMNLSKEADIYVNECFSTSHREHASFIGIAQLLPSYAGLHLIKEVNALKKVLSNSEKPFVAVIGGVKLETKKPVISSFLKLADKVLIGGRIGLEWKEEVPSNLVLPLDYALEEKDLGEKTIVLYEKIISTAKTIVWAGPMGLFEEPAYEEGTKRVGVAIANSNAYTVIGGGDTVSALHIYGLFGKMGFVSSGGGAMLEFLAKGNLVGLEVLGYHG